MKKKAGLAIGAMLFLVIGIFVLHRYLPGRKWMELTEYYGISENETGVIVNSENTGLKAVQQDGTYYLSAELVQNYVNERFYWDGSHLLYTLPDRTVVYSPGEEVYLDGIEEREREISGCIYQENTLWIGLDVVAEYTNMTYTLEEDPGRIWIWSDWEQPVSYASAKKKSAVRYRAGIKSPILAELEKGSKVLVLDTDVPGWTKVQTTEGLIGYVQEGRLSDTTLYQPSHDFTEPEYLGISVEETIVMVWHQNLDNAGIYELPGILERSRGLNVIAPSWFTLSDDTGGFVSRADGSYTELAHEAGVSVWGMVDNLNLPVDTYQVLSVTENRNRLIKGLMEEANVYGLDGINVDFESLPEECGVHFAQFIRELSVACHQAGLVLSVDNYAPESGTGYYNRAEQALYADYIMVMAYDEHWNGGGVAGSTSSYPFAERAITDTLEEVPAEKLVLAIPFYTRLWEEDADSKAVGMKELSELLPRWGKPVWLEKERQYFATGTIGEETVSVWVEDLDTLSWRLSLAEHYGLAGVSAWKAGLELDEAWELLQAYGEKQS